MTWVDGVMLAVVLLSAAFSMVRGFVREILGVGAWIGAALAARAFYPYVEPYVASVLAAKNLVFYVSVIVVFIVVLIVLSIVSALIAGQVRDSALSGVDRSLGLVFGLARGVFIICLAYIALSVAVPAPQWPAPVVNARFLPLAFQGATTLVTILPPGPYRPKVDPLPSTPAPPASVLMQQPVSGSALQTE
jgi:membrane protein required for colicin V production